MNREEQINWRLGWLAAGIGFAAFAVTMLNGFVYDDYYYVVENVWLRDWHNWWALVSDWRASVQQPGFPSGFWRPLRNVDFLLDYQFAGLNAAWFHFENLLWHGVSTLGLYGLLRRLRASPSAAFLATAFFACHPAQTESVAWVKERDGILSGAALFWSLYHAAGERPRSVVASLALLIVALLCKESAVVFLPLCAAVVAIQWKWQPAFSRSRSAVLLAVGFGITIGFLALRTEILGHVAQVTRPMGGTLPATLWTMCGVLVRYLWVIVDPRAMEITYEWITPAAGVQALPLLGVALLLAMFGVGAALAKKIPLAAFGIFWFLAALIPFANVIPMMQWMAVRFLYVPIAGIAILLAILMERALAGRRIRYRNLPAFHAASAVLIALLAFASAMESLHWRSNATLWGRAYEIRPDDPTIMATYADYLDDLHRYQEAIGVLANYPFDAVHESDNLAWKAKTRALDGLGRGPESLATAQSAAARFPRQPAAALYLALTESRFGNPDRAAAAWEHLLELDHFHKGAMEQLIKYYDKQGKKDRADELRARLKRMETLPREEWRIEERG